MYENEFEKNERYTTYQTDGFYNSSNSYGSDASGKDKEPKKGGFARLALSAGVGLVFGAFAALAFFGVNKAMDYFSPTEESSAPSEVMAGDSFLPAEQMTNVNQITYVQDDVSDVVEEVMPAMVSIVNNYSVTTSTFWGQSISQQASSSGSGIIVGETDTELLIVSNNHVVEGTDSLEVTFIDGSTAKASIKGLDSDMDLAVIAVDITSLTEETKDAITIAELGDSDQLKLGTPVIAIGNALGFGQSVTTGVVSALNREVTYDDGSKGTYIQTDAAINQGNSGGALLNVNGEIIGINSSKIGGTMVEGMGYAIPISSASPIVADLMNRKTRVEVPAEEMGYMGVVMQNVTDQIMEMYGMPKGVFIYDVEKDSPADQAGIKKGDIIVKFDGARISSNADVQENMQYFRAGDEAQLIVKRRALDGEYVDVEINITFGKRPENP
ncbi:MAG: trypsin-like peptidase domain-containing protein [Lachnospiraceae bacterium]|nr:trypsin-like peptidase domain-containing protein [Lachnospiraceae bacterium]